MSAQIPRDKIDLVKNKADIVEIIGRSVQLKRSGKDFKGICPFVKEKRPSFYVSPSKNIFKCFGCGHGGDIFKFVQLHQNVEFPEAVRKVADMVGVRL